MNQFIFISEPDTESIHTLRTHYLNGFPCAQEYYLELLIANASRYLIKQRQETIGYFILSQDDRLLEFYITPEWFALNDVVFGNILQEFSVKRALCKSFDAAMLSCCSQYQTGLQPVGILFREYEKKPPLHPATALSIRRAIPEDEMVIITANEEVFDHPSEVAQYITAKQIFLYEKERDLVGFGIYSPVFPGRLDYDIGMLVLPAYRGKGYGQLIVQHLAAFCQQNGWHPSAGCAIENVASRRCLERSGFVARHRLLEFFF